MERSELRKVWANRIGEYRQSGLSAREWCRANGVRPDRLKYWLSKVKANEKPDSVDMRWSELQVVESDSLTDAGIAVHVGSARIEVKAGFDRALLAEVLRVVSAAC